MNPQTPMPSAGTLPDFVYRLTCRLPPFPGSSALAVALNTILVERLPPDLLATLEGRSMVIELADLGMRLSLRVLRGRFLPTHSSAAPAIHFRATVHDFMLLAAGEEDADALFFQRRLAMQGDTELALMAKNTLDALDLPRARAVLRFVLKLLPVPSRRTAKNLPSA